MPRKPDEIVHLQLRLTEFLRARLAAEAKYNQRSLNGEIVHRLAYSVEKINHERRAGKGKA